MSTRSQLTKDLNDSVTALLGKRIKILFKNVVRLETKSEKSENRLLVFSPCRLFLLTAKVPTRIDCHFHYLDIKGIETRHENQLCLLVGEKWFVFICSSKSEVEGMLSTLSSALQVIFPAVPLSEVIEGKISVDCHQYEKVVTSALHCTAPCGAFSTQYACMCDYHGLPYREEVAWDIDRIYASHETRVLSIRDFDHLEPKDLVPLVSALQHNLWFRSLRIASLKLTHEAIDRLLHVVSTTSSLQALHLNHLALKHEFVSKLATAVQSNPHVPLHTLDLSNNLLEDKSVSSINAIITKIVQSGREGLKKLEVSGCGLTPRGVSSLTQTLAQLKPLTLTHLNLSHNLIKDEISGLCNLLADPNNITHLDISSTDILLDSDGVCQVFGALLRGCTTHLSHLDVSKNGFSLKKTTREMPPSFKQFFTASLALKYLNMSHCKLTTEPLKNLLLGLACNESTAGLVVDLSCNTLGAHGAHVLESCIHGVAAISSLDISENGLESELGGVISAIGKNKSITHLRLNKNLVGLKSKHISPVMDSLVHTIQEEDCVMENLSMSDCKLKSELFVVINALGSNHCLKHLDISGNAVGDSGARLLAKALQTNNKLKTVILDRNNITISGYSEIAYALNSNSSLVYLGPLVHDIMTCMKLSLERTEQVMASISESLFRNSSTVASPRLTKHQGSVDWHMQTRVLDHVAQTVRDSLPPPQTEDSSPPHYIDKLLVDAEAAKQTKRKMCEIMDQTDITSAVENLLTQTSSHIQALIQTHLQEGVERMISSAGDLMPTVMSDEVKACLKSKINAKLSDDVLSTVSAALPPPARASAAIAKQTNELGTNLAKKLTDSIMEEVMHLLNKAQHNLTGDKRSSTPDVLRTMPRQYPDSSYPFATPQLMNRRKSCFSRKLRPNSVTDTLSAEHIPDLLPSITSPQEGLDWESLDSVCETSGQRLQHLVKGRPRRAKTRAPSRPTNHHKLNSLLTDTDECDTDNQSTLSEISTAPTAAPKPRPWSALCNDKSVSEVGSSESTATNTPDSTDPPSLTSTGFNADT